MKLAKFSMLSAIFTVMLSLQPMAGWASRVVGPTVTGPITASPSTTQIEIAHQTYHIQANSPAAKTVHSFFLGQVVDAVLTAAGGTTAPEVVSITAHAGS
jgi:hypothetical protein